MKSGVWAVVPNLRPWRGDMRRNPQPYYYGVNMTLSEMGYCQNVKWELESRGISCLVQLVEL